ncbi:hypothetical protein [Chryseobacterium sp. MP_3.2]|uniref:hypothetical protein n=1 Tax=Chryseobacterium sp. MP_3.2 TaxID=3071712 RepID=UPI002E0B18E8|nr:putative transcriptional regulator [Chryseobacterium sp. MP_3.2]
MIVLTKFNCKKSWEILNSENPTFIAESPSIYKSEQPMTEQEVEDYFKEEVVVLPDFVLEIIKIGMDDVKNGRVHSNEEVEKYFEEWLKD